MGTMTAQLLVGQTHPYEGGLINHSHTLYLTENSVSAWTIVPSPTHRSKQSNPEPKYTWIPTLEHMLEDGLLMAALLAIKDQVLINKAKNLMSHLNPEQPTMLYDILSETQLVQLHQQVRKLNSPHKLILTIHKGSSLRSQIDVVQAYQQFDMEVCLSMYVKERGGFGQILVDQLFEKKHDNKF